MEPMTTGVAPAVRALRLMRRIAALGLVLLAVLSATASARAEPSEAESADNVKEARARFRRGVELYDEGDLDAALVELRRAYALSPSYKLLFNIAQVHAQRSDYASALEAFQRYLAEGAKAVPAPRRRQVEAEIEKLSARVAELEIKANVDGAEVQVDDVVRGTTPLEAPLIVNAGRRKVSLAKNGRHPVVRYVEVAGAERSAIAVELVEPSPAPAAAAPVERPETVVTERPRSEPRAKQRRESSTAPSKPSFPWAAWLATGVLASGGIVLGVLSLDAARDLDRKRETFGVTRSDLDRTATRTERLALAADIVGGAAVLMGGVSIYLTLRPGTEQHARPQATAWPSGIVASGRF